MKTVRYLRLLLLVFFCSSTPGHAQETCDEMKTKLDGLEIYQKKFESVRDKYEKYIETRKEKWDRHPCGQCERIVKDYKRFICKDDPDTPKCQEIIRSYVGRNCKELLKKGGNCKNSRYYTTRDELKEVEKKLGVIKYRIGTIEQRYRQKCKEDTQNHRKCHSELVPGNHVKPWKPDDPDTHINVPCEQKPDGKWYFVAHRHLVVNCGVQSFNDRNCNEPNGPKLFDPDNNPCAQEPRKSERHDFE